MIHDKDMMNSKKAFYTLILIAVFAAILASSSLLQGWIQSYVGELMQFQRHNPVWAVLIFMLFAALSVLLGPFSSFPLVPAAVSIWGEMQTLIMLYSGWLVGNVSAYAIGYYFGRPVLNKIIGEQKITAWLDSIKNRLTFTVLLLFRIATPSETGYVFGLIRYSVRKYLLITLLAELPFVVLAVFAGSALTNSGTGTLIALAGIWIAVLAIAFALFKKAR